MPRLSTARWRALAPVTIGLAILGGAAAMLSVPASGADTAPAPLVPDGARRVTVAEVTVADDVAAVRLHGRVRAVHRAALAFPAGGRVTARAVSIGDRVRQGDLLARADRADVTADASAARASVAELDERIAQARRERERVERLFAIGALPRAQLEGARSAEAALDASRRGARAGVARSGHALADTRLRAPFDGTVTAVFLEPGEQAAPGQPVLELAGDGPREVLVGLPLALLSRVAAGDAGELRVGARAFAATVTRIGAGAREDGLFPLTARLDEDGAPLGADATLSLRSATDQALAVPPAAVSDPSGRRPHVLVVRDGRATRVDVTIGHLAGERVRVRGDLSAGDRVVVGGLAFLLDGDPVEVTP